MRIAHVTPVYPPYRGGMAHVAGVYTERLRARRHDVHVFAPEHPTGFDHPSHVHQLPVYFRYGNAGVVRGLVPRLTHFDVVHLHYPFYGGAELVARARATDRLRALIVTFYMDAVDAGSKGTAFDLHRAVVQPWILRHADRILVSSMDYAASSSLASLGDAPVEALPFGVDNQHFFPAASSEPREPTVPTILFVGTLDRAHRFKGVDILLSALKRLSNLSWSLSIVGDGGDRLALERTAAELGLERRVAFAGDVSDRELPDRYRTAALHVLPSTERAEAFGLVTLEAAASGIPSIVSDLPGVRTTVVHGETGLIVPPGDPAALALALRELLQSPARRQELGRNARRRAERYYAWDPHIDRLEAIYASVVGAKPAGTL